MTTITYKNIPFWIDLYNIIKKYEISTKFIGKNNIFIQTTIIYDNIVQTIKKYETVQDAILCHHAYMLHVSLNHHNVRF